MSGARLDTLLEPVIQPVIAAGTVLLAQPLAAAALLLAAAAGLLVLAADENRPALARRRTACIAIGCAGQALIALGHYYLGLAAHGAAAAALAAILFLQRRRSDSAAESTPTIRQMKPRWMWLAALGLFTVALALRLYRLETASPRINDTAAKTALAAISLLDQGAPPTFWRLTAGTLFHSRESPVYVASMAAVMKLADRSLIAVRLTDVLWAMASLLLTYWLGWRLWGRGPALLALGFLALCRWHGALSRPGTYLMATIVCAQALMLLVISHIERPRWWTYPLLGALIPACSYFYSAIRPQAVIALALALLPLIRGPRRGRALVGLLLLSGALLLAAQPQWPKWRGFQRDYFFQRPNSPPDVAVWAKTADGEGIITAFDPEATAANLKLNLKKIIAVFYANGSISPVYSALLLPSAVLLAAGTLSHRLLLLWGMVGLSPGLLIAPPTRRMILVIPVLALSSAWVLTGALDNGQRGTGRTRRNKAAAWVVAGALAGLMVMDVAAPFTELRYRHVRDSAYGHPHRDRFGWALRDAVEIGPVFILDSKPDRPVLDLLLHRIQQRNGDAADYQFVAEEEFLAWINDPGTSGRVSLGFLCSGQDDSDIERTLLDAIAKRWPRAPVIEGAWSNNYNKIAFRIVLPWGKWSRDTVLPAGPWDPVRLVSARFANNDSIRRRAALQKQREKQQWTPLETDAAGAANNDADSADDEAAVGSDDADVFPAGEPQ